MTTDKLRTFLLEQDNILRPAGQLDLLPFYAVMADANSGFMGDREIATKILIPDGPTLIKRGSDLPPLTAEELAGNVDRDFVELRKEIEHLKDARGTISDKQDLIWQYVFPRKYMALFYATNHEGRNQKIERVFFDIDRGPGVSAEQALQTAQEFVMFLEEDEQTAELTDQLFISWTGKSFHVYLFLNQPQDHAFYEEEIHASTTEELDTITERGVRAIQSSVETEVLAGHEEKENTVSIDPSQTPSGKLDRFPLGSLHMKDPKTVDGISVPITREELFQDDIVETLESYSPRDVLEKLEELEKKLPS